jgi:hypothetical protein
MIPWWFHYYFVRLYWNLRIILKRNVIFKRQEFEGSNKIAVFTFGSYGIIPNDGNKNKPKGFGHSAGD